MGSIMEEWYQRNYLKMRDRVYQLEAALREIADGPTCCPVSNAMRDIACGALEGKAELQWTENYGQGSEPWLKDDEK